MSETELIHDIENPKQGRKRDVWLVLLYLFVTLIVNLGALLAVPKFATPATAKQTLPFYALPVLWAGYLLFMYRTGPLRWLGYFAALPGLFWLFQVIGDI